MNIKDLKQKIETNPHLRLSDVYDDILYADVFRIKSKLEKYCPDVQLKNKIYYYSKSLVSAEKDVYRVRFVVSYSVELNDDLQRSFCIARNYDECLVCGVRSQTVLYPADDENAKNQKFSAQLNVALQEKEKTLLLDTMDDDYLRKVDILLWKDHISYYKDRLCDNSVISKHGELYQPLYITKGADAHKLCIYLPKMNKIMWEMVEENVETLKLKRAGEITEYIKNKHKAITHKKEEICNLEADIDKALAQKDKILKDNSSRDIEMLLTRKI